MNGFIKYLLLLAVATCVLSSCSKFHTIGAVNGDVVNFVVTKAGESNDGLPEGATVRVLTYGTYDSYKPYKVGTYKAGAGDILIPAVLNNDGTVADNKTSEEHRNAALSQIGAQGNNSRSYYVCLVSPGYGHNEADFSVSYNPHPSDNPQTNGKLLVNDAVTKTLGGYPPVDMSNAVLKDRRSKIQVNFYKLNNENVPEYSVENVRLINAGSDGCNVNYYPATRQVVDPSDGQTGRKIVMKQPENSAPVQMNVSGQVYEVVPKYNADAPLFIPSAIYLPKDKVMSRLKVPEAYAANSDYLYLAFSFTQDGKTTNIKIPISDRKYNEFEPMSEYTFNIVVTSLYQSLTISVTKNDNDENSWEEVTINNKVEGGISQAPEMIWTINDWNNSEQEENI